MLVAFFYQYPRSNSEPVIIRPPADVDETGYDFKNYITSFGGYASRQQDSPLNDSSDSSLEDCDLDNITPVGANIIYTTFFKISKFSSPCTLHGNFCQFPSPTSSYFDSIFGSKLKKKRKKVKPAFNHLTHGLIFCQFCAKQHHALGKIQKLWSLFCKVLFHVPNIRYISIRNPEHCGKRRPCWIGNHKVICIGPCWKPTDLKRKYLSQKYLIVFLSSVFDLAIARAAGAGFLGRRQKSRGRAPEGRKGDGRKG